MSSYKHYDCEKEELLKVLSQEEYDFITTLKIPYHGNTAGLWAKKYFIDEKVKNAIESGEVKKVKYEPIQQQRAPYQISDYISGGDLRSMADGKIYDSKSKYYKSLKEQGMVIVDEPPKERKNKEVDWEKALVETCNKVGI